MQEKRPPSDRQHAPHLVQATTRNARTKNPNDDRAGPSAPTVITSHFSDRGALSMRLRSTRRWQDRRRTCRIWLFFRSRAALRSAGGACPRFAAGRAALLLWCGSEVGLGFELVGVAAAVDLDSR